MSQWEKVLEALAMAGAEGITLEDIHTLTDVPAASASAAIRDMRASKTANIVSIRPDGTGPWTYRLELTP